MLEKNDPSFVEYFPLPVGWYWGSVRYSYSYNIPYGEALSGRSMSVHFKGHL